MKHNRKQSAKPMHKPGTTPEALDKLDHFVIKNVVKSAVEQQRGNKITIKLEGRHALYARYIKARKKKIERILSKEIGREIYIDIISRKIFNEKNGNQKKKNLLSILGKINMLKDAKILKAFTLNFDIFRNIVVLINEKERNLALEYHLPHKLENEMMSALISCGIREINNKMLHDPIEGLLDRLSYPIYHSMAKEKGWPLSWVRKNMESSLGDFQTRDTVIRVSLHPLSLKEKKERIYKSITNEYIAVKTSRMKNETEIERFTDQVPLSGNRWPWAIKVNDKIIVQFIKRLQKDKIIDDECNISLSDKKFEQYIRKMVDPEDKNTHECEYEPCGKPFVRISRKRIYCSDSCKYMAWRAKKKGNSKDRN